MGWLVGFYFRLLSCCSAYCLLKTSFLAFSRNKTKNVRARAEWNSAQMSNRLQHISRRHHHQATSKCDKRASESQNTHFTSQLPLLIIKLWCTQEKDMRTLESSAGITCETEPRAREMRKNTTFDYQRRSSHSNFTSLFLRHNGQQFNNFPVCVDMYSREWLIGEENRIQIFFETLHCFLSEVYESTSFRARDSVSFQSTLQLISARSHRVPVRSIAVESVIFGHFKIF